MIPIAIRKAQPSPGDVHVNRPLTNVSVGWLQRQDQYIAGTVFPVVPVAKQSDVYYIFSRADWLRAVAEKRAPSTETAGGGYGVSTASYRCHVWGFHKDVDDQLRGNADVPLSPDRNATQFVTQACMTRRELEWASTFFTTGVWTGSTTGTDIVPGTKWDNASGTPIEDIRAQIYSIWGKTGYRPNTLVLGVETWQKLQDVADFVDRVKAGQTPGGPAIVNKAALAQVLEIDRVVTPGAVYNAGPEGGTEATSFVMSADDALLLYVAPSPGVEVPTAGYTFAWTGMFGANAATGTRIRKFRMEHLSSDRVECEMAWALKVVAPELGCFFDNTMT